jgi:hypothetical protein
MRKDLSIRDNEILKHKQDYLKDQGNKGTDKIQPEAELIYPEQVEP